MVEVRVVEDIVRAWPTKTTKQDTKIMKKKSQTRYGSELGLLQIHYG